MMLAAIDWSENLFRYCERGTTAALLAEPLNSLSNSAFVAVALCAAVRLTRVMDRTGISTRDFAALALLIALTTAIGLGSLAFHISATRLAQLADIIPIGLFVIAYVAFALRVMLQVTVPTTVAATLLLAGSMSVAGVLCQPTGASLAAALALPTACMNGSAAYTPALAALLAVAATLRHRRHVAATHFAAATALFALALASRTFDLVFCPLFRAGPIEVTTHTLWHLANAGVIHLLLIAAMTSTAARRNDSGLGNTSTTALR